MSYNRGRYVGGVLSWGRYDRHSSYHISLEPIDALHGYRTILKKMLE